MFWPFGSKACRILDPWPGMKPAPSALEGKALTTGPPGKSQTPLVLDKEIMQMLCPTVLRTLPSPHPQQADGSAGRAGASQCVLLTYEDSGFQAGLADSGYRTK